MTDHLADCDDYAFSGSGFHPNCERICICRQVRRIEKRMLDAAREAIEAVDPPSEAYDDWYPKGKRLALAAIDALDVPTGGKVSSAWRPSNGTEGEVFAASRCEQCVNDRWDHVTATGQSCPIWMNALAGVDDFHLYWDADAGHGECDMFYPTSEARAAGVQAARDAVADMTPFVFAYQTWMSGDYGYDEGPWVKKENVLAAIDALRGEL